jgi:hypothetical protein
MLAGSGTVVGASKLKPTESAQSLIDWLVLAKAGQCAKVMSSLNVVLSPRA